LWLAVGVDVRDTSRVGVVTPAILINASVNSESSPKFAISPAFTIEKRRHRDALRPYVCAAILLSQVALLAYHRFSAGRLNRLAPFSGQTSYRVAGTINEVPLGGDMLRARYGLAPRGIVSGSPDDLRRILRLRESENEGEATVYLRLHTRQNGGPEEIWLWPQQ